MAIIDYIGSIMDHSANSGDWVIDTNSVWYNPTYSTSCLLSNTGNAGSYLDWSNNAGTRTELWVSFRARVAYYVNNAASAPDSSVFVFGDPTSWRFRFLTFDPTSYFNEATYHLQAWNGSSWVTLNTRTGYIVTATDTNINRYDIGLKLGVSDGFIRFYVNGVLMHSWEGNTSQYLPSNNISYFRHTKPTRQLSNLYNVYTVSNMFFSDITSNKTFMIERNISADGSIVGDWIGDYTSFSGTLLPSDMSFIATSTNEDIKTFTKSSFPSSPFSSGYDIIGLGVSASSSKGETGPGSLKFVARHGSVNGESTSKPLGLSIDAYKHIFTQNPSTSQAWTFAEADAAEVGIKSSLT